MCAGAVAAGAGAAGSACHQGLQAAGQQPPAAVPPGGLCSGEADTAGIPHQLLLSCHDGFSELIGPSLSAVVRCFP